MPGLSWEIVRPKQVHLTGVDLDGNEVSIEADEIAGPVLPARARPPRRRAAARAARRRHAQGGAARPSASWASARRCWPTPSPRAPGCRSADAVRHPADEPAARASPPGPPRLPGHARDVGRARCGPWSSAGHDVALVVSQPDRRGAAAARRRRRRSRRPRSTSGWPSPTPSTTCSSVGRRPGVVVAFGRLIKPARARRAADGEPALLAAAPVAGRGAGRAGDPGRRRAHRRRPHGGRGGPRHRRGLRPRRGDDRPRRDGRRAPGPAVDRRGRACWSTNLARGPGRARLRRWASRPTPHKLDRRRAASSTGPARRWTIHRLVRVGGAWTTWNGARLKVWRTVLVPGSATSVRIRARRRRACGRGRARRRRPRPARRGAARGQAPHARRGLGPWAARRPRRRARTVTDRRPARTPRGRRSGHKGSGRRGVSALGPAGGARRARPHRRRRGLRQPRAVGGARPLRAARRRPPVRHRPRVRHDARMRRACDYLVDRFLARPVGRHGPQRPAPRRLPARLRRCRCRTRRWARRSGWRPGRPVAWSTPCSGGSPTRRCRGPTTPRG